MIINKTINCHYDFTNDEGRWLIGKCKTIVPKNYESHHSLSGQRWGGIQKRCEIGGSQQKKYPRYIGTQNLFRDFQEFVEWSRGEVGYELREDVGKRSWAYSIDKDILGLGRKIYSPETCLFVPNAVNMFLTARNASRGNYPLGVSWMASSGKLQAQIRIRTGKKYLGLFEDPMEAHRAWQKAKIRLGRDFALEFEPWHPKLYVGMNAWIDIIQNDYDNQRETII